MSYFIPEFGVWAPSWSLLHCSRVQCTLWQRFMPCQLASMHRAVPGYSWTTQFWGGKGLVVWMWAAPCHLPPGSQNRYWPLGLTAVDVSYRSWLTPGGSEEASCDCSKHDSTEKKVTGTTPRRSPKAFRCAVHQQKDISGHVGYSSRNKPSDAFCWLNPPGLVNTLSDVCSISWAPNDLLSLGFRL